MSAGMSAGSPRKPTARQLRILGWIEEFVSAHGMPPTVREIGRAFGIASSSVFKHLKALEKKGLLRRGELGARSLELTGTRRARVAPARSGRGGRSGRDESRSCDDCANVPLVGRIAAGEPILAAENVEGEVTVARRLVRSGSYFALRVKGESMVDAGILDGDTVIVRAQSEVEWGEIAVCLVSGDTDEDEATLKRVYRASRGRLRLQPENSGMKPMMVPASEVAIQGKVVAVQRTM